MNVALLNMSDDRNKGDLAILESTVGLLRKKYPRCSITLFNVDYSDGEVNDPRRFHHVNSLGLKAHHGSFFPAVFSGKGKALSLLEAGLNLLGCLRIWVTVSLAKSRSPSFLGEADGEKIQSLLRADRIILKGGSYIFSYGGIRQSIYLYRMLFPTLLSLALGKNVRALGHSFGPFRGYFSRKLAGRCLRRLEKIVVRDALSRDLLRREFKIPASKIAVLPDLAFWTGPVSPPGGVSSLSSIMEKEGLLLDAPPPLKIGLTVRKWRFPGFPRPARLFQAYLQAVSGAVEELHSRFGARTFVMPHALEDAPVAERVRRMARSARPVLLTGDYATAVLRDLYGEMDLFIATRIHSALFALSRSTPVIAIAYEKPKAYGIVGETLGREAVLEIETVTTRQIVDKVEEIIREGPPLRRDIRGRWEKLRDKLENSLDEIFGQDSLP